MAKEYYNDLLERKENALSRKRIDLFLLISSIIGESAAKGLQGSINIMTLSEIMYVIQIIKTLSIADLFVGPSNARHDFLLEMDRSFEAKDKIIENITPVYDEFLKRCKEFYSTLSLVNPVEFQSAYCYKLERGYYSVNKHFEFRESIKDIDKLIGINIMNGNGVCRDLDQLLSDILNTCGIESYTFRISYNKDTTFGNDNQKESSDTKFTSPEEVSLFYIIGLLLMYLPLKLLPNHVVSGSIFKEQSYILDSTNKIAYRAQSGKYLYSLTDNLHKSVAFPISTSLKLRPNVVKNEKGHSRIEFYDKKMLKGIRELLSLGTISYEEYLQMWNDTKIKMERNTDMLEDFYRENQEAYQFISDEINKLPEFTDVLKKVIKGR